jgi:HD-GYP domain-containing protein (c-di-GMP phosphodiesterase class II)
MANIVIWGRARDIVTGELPAAASVAEVTTLAELRRELGETSAALVLGDPARMEADRGELEGFSAEFVQAVFVAVVDHGDAEETLKRYPFLSEVLLRPVTESRLRLRLERALETIHNRRVIRQLERALDRKSENLEELNKIGVALSVERDPEKLLQLILEKSRAITHADAGSLYLVERGKDEDDTKDDQLSFMLAQNDSVEIPFKQTVVPLDQTSIAGYVALTGTSVNVADAYNLPPGSTYAISRAFDEKSGYRTKSMLVVPMCDHRNRAIGVVQLINKKTDPAATLRSGVLVDEVVIPFTQADGELVGSLASQAAVAYENARLIDRMKGLFESFVSASVTTIEKRDPTTSGHSQRVARLTVLLAEKVDSETTGPFKDRSFSRDQIDEIRYASLLHDFGKVGVKEKFLLKASKLYDSHLDIVKQRFDYIQRTVEVEHLREKLRLIEARAPRQEIEKEDQRFELRRQEVQRMVETILRANKTTVLDGEDSPALAALAKETYRDLAGQEHPFITKKEHESLSIRRGSLTESERDSINQHVQNTYEFLRELPWTNELRRVPEIAWSHHEKLDGTGYPRHLKAADIPIQPRMMTISDIFDALVANDRPYKRAVPRDKALDILQDEARHGKIDQDLLDIFVGAKVYEITCPSTKEEAELTRTV